MVYVKHMIEENGEKVAKLLDEGGYVYVCGDAKYMAPDVRDALGRVLAKYKGLPEDKGKALIEEMVKDKRYLEDVWASS